MDGFVKSPCGIPYRMTNEINNAWSEYDKIVGNIHLGRYGVIIIDIYGFPIDNEFDLEGIETQVKYL